MQKQEFEERIERTVTDEQYKVIEEVYMWHPSIRNTSGKQEKAAKVITIPTDRTYQQGFRAEKREEPEADSEYMSRQAENALKKLRAIGG